MQLSINFLLREPSAAGYAAPPLAGRLRALIVLVAFNSLIGLAFWAGRREGGPFTYLVISNGIGLSASLISDLLEHLSRRRIRLLPKVLIVAPSSVIAGVEMGALINPHVPHLIGQTNPDVWLGYGSSFVVTGAACAFFTMLVDAARLRTTLETERREAAEARQSETAAQLALLQAQIEPHFLFNTLANVQSLIERDPARASTMLDNLNRYLRATLGRTRRLSATLDEELDLVGALLNIASIRLGDRLRYTVDVPPGLRSIALAPLLLQPLVENALLHGIEPSIDGGEIRITGARNADLLTLAVTDTGVGLGGNPQKLHSGLGLANVRARLKRLYGERARVTVEANPSPARGATATLCIPVQPAHPIQRQPPTDD